MKKTLMIVAIFLGLLTSPCIGQELKIGLGGNGNDFHNETICNNDGSFTVLSYSSSEDGDISENIGGYDIWIVKLSKDGKRLWSKNFGTATNDDPDDMLVNKSGNLIVAAHTWDSSKAKNALKTIKNGTEDLPINEIILLEVNHDNGKLINEKRIRDVDNIIPLQIYSDGKNGYYLYVNSFLTQVPDDPKDARVKKSVIKRFRLNSKLKVVAKEKIYEEVNKSFFDILYQSENANEDDYLYSLQKDGIIHFLVSKTQKIDVKEYGIAKIYGVSKTSNSYQLDIMTLDESKSESMKITKGEIIGDKFSISKDITLPKFRLTSIIHSGGYTHFVGTTADSTGIFKDTKGINSIVVTKLDDKYQPISTDIFELPQKKATLEYSTLLSENSILCTFTSGYFGWKGKRNPNVIIESYVIDD